MKRFLTLALVASCTLGVSATEYTEDLVVTVNGTSTEPQSTTVTIEQNEDETYKLSLNNFIMVSDGVNMGIGNIVVDNVAGTTEGDIVTLESSQTITIAAGDDSYITDGTISMWMGPYLGEVPIVMAAKLKGEEAAYFTIDIEMVSLGQTINVVFGDASEFDTPISNITVDNSKEVEAMYNLSGQKVTDTQKGQIYIIKYSDGSVVKTIAK